MSVKRRELTETAGADAAWREKWGTKFRMKTSLAREMLAQYLLNVKINVWIK